MPQISAPPLDAEKASSQQLVDNFCPPPDLESKLSRSTLVVGTRGSGKTYYLRHCKHSCEGLALYGDLRKILNPLSCDTGAGGTTFREIAAADEAPIRRKAVALLAYWLHSRCNEEEVAISNKPFHSVLPKDIRKNTDPDHSNFVDEVREQLEDAPLSYFRQRSNRTAFEEFLEKLSTTITQSHGDFTILLDRAEEVPYPGLTPVMNLLDQSHSFKTVVATRPGILGPEHQLTIQVPIPGDHYNVRHLGATPYSESWRDLVKCILSNWFPISEIGIPPIEQEWVCHVARDSIRIAIEIVYNALNSEGVYEIGRARRQLELIKGWQLVHCQGQLRRLNPDISRILKKLRAQMDKNQQPWQLPIRIETGEGRQKRFSGMPRHIRDMSKDEQIIYLGLRTGLFTTINGTSWHPACFLDEVEIPPLFLWRDGDKWSSM